MTPFWMLPNKSNSVIIEDDDSLSYQQLDEKVQVQLETFPVEKQLVALVAENTIRFIVTYLALLRGKHLILLLDSSKSECDNKATAELYGANYFVTEHGCMLLNREQKKLAAELALLLPTSGSTGSAKFVKLTFTNLAHNCQAITAVLPIVATDCAMTSLPLSYSFGLSILHTHLSVGASLVLGQQSVMAKSFWTQFEQHKVNSFYGVPFSFEMLHRLGFQRLPLGQLKYFAQAGGKLNAQLWKALQTYSLQSSTPFYAMYGQTEATARIAIMDPDIFITAPEGSIGTSLPECKLYIESHNDEGELLFEGPNVFAGYACGAGDLAHCEQINILRTGDIAKYSALGLIEIVGRSKRIAKIQGRRVNLDELESQISSQLDWQCVITSDDKVLDVFYEKHLDEAERKIADIALCHFALVKLHHCDHIPRLKNGKVDYCALK